MKNISFHPALKIAQDFRFIKKNYFSLRDNTLSYWRYRILRPFLKAYNEILITRYKDAPWLTPAAVEILNSVLTQDMTGFEFGSGRSTIWIGRRVKKLISIEHSREWFNEINRKIISNQMHNITYKLIEPENQPKANVNYPKNNYENIVMEYSPASCYEDYYNYINNFPDEYFDFVIVDGRARTECCLAGMKKISKGGILVLDNSERERYAPAKKILSNWPKIHTSTGLTDTTFWFRPK